VGWEISSSLRGRTCTKVGEDVLVIISSGYHDGLGKRQVQLIVGNEEQQHNTKDTLHVASASVGNMARCDITDDRTGGVACWASRKSGSSLTHLV
jgi:hypothetical protein